MSSRQFKESSATISSDLCSWFELMSGSENVFQLCNENDKQNTVHSYLPLSAHLQATVYKPISKTERQQQHHACICCSKSKENDDNGLFEVNRQLQEVAIYSNS